MIRIKQSQFPRRSDPNQRSASEGLTFARTRQSDHQRSGLALIYQLTAWR